MKNFEGEKGIGMSERQAKRFLTQSRSTLILGTTNPDGTPMIHPVWFYFDSKRVKLYFYTEPNLKKAVNIKERGSVYFDVDNDKWPYKGVKGKAQARLITRRKDALSFGSKILAKYVRKGEPLMKAALEKINLGGYIVFELTPSYLTSWDYGKLAAKGGSSFLEAVIS